MDEVHFLRMYGNTSEEFEVIIPNTLQKTLRSNVCKPFHAFKKFDKMLYFRYLLSLTLLNFMKMNFTEKVLWNVGSSLQTTSSFTRKGIHDILESDFP